MFIIPDQQTDFWNQKSLDFRNFVHAWTHACTSFPRLGDRTPSKICLGVDFVMKACVASFFPLFIFYEAIQWFHADGNFIFQLTFKRETKLSVISSDAISSKTTTIIEPAVIDWNCFHQGLNSYYYYIYYYHHHHHHHPSTWALEVLEHLFIGGNEVLEDLNLHVNVTEVFYKLRWHFIV